jgi:hypothetical protein
VTRSAIRRRCPTQFLPLLLIRYELTGQVRFLTTPCPCGTGLTRIDEVQGRLEDLFNNGAEAALPGRTALVFGQIGIDAISMLLAASGGFSVEHGRGVG